MQAVKQDHSKDIARASANRHADAYLTGSLRNSVGHDAVEADRREDKRKYGEAAEEQSLHSGIFGLTGNDISHGARMQQGKSAIEILDGDA
jgi:hypothetical protein